MRSSNRITLITTLAIEAGVLMTFGSMSSAFASNEERADRIVDQASVAMQDDADRELSAMAKKYRGTDRESDMLLRLAELRLEIAEGLFRVAYGPGETALKAEYQKKISSSLVPLNRILETYSKSEVAPRALFLRGKARKDLSQDAAALKDLESFLAKYPSREEAPVAAMGVADLSIAKQNYARATSVLGVVLAKPAHPLYPNALAKRAWALQVDGHPNLAVADLRTLAKFFQTRATSKTLSSGDEALRQSVLADVPSIAYLAYRANPRQFSLVQMNELLRSFDTSDGYRRMAIKIAEALRVADLNADLRSWKAIVLKSDPSKKESFPMLVSVLEYDLDREAFADVTKTSSDIADILSKHPETEEAESARRLVVRAIDKLTKRLTDYKATVKANEAERYLSVLLPTFDRMTTEADARRIAMRWNIAETYFNLDRYESAAAMYRWVYENWNEDAEASLTKVTRRSGAALKAISSRYESLRAMKLIPENLEAAASIAHPQRDARKVALLREWMNWIDSYSSESSMNLASEMVHFEFEADRTLYSFGFQDEAMERLKKLTLNAPNSKVAIPAASLVVDTWIARKRWDHVEAESKSFAQAFASNRSFSGKMAAQAASAKFKRAELAYASKSYSEAITQAKEFVNSYGKTSLAIDASGMVCNAHLASNDLDSAVECFSNFAATYSGTPAAKQALRSAARIEDERYHFASAMNLYLRYLSAAKSGLSASEKQLVRKRILLLSRATGDADEMARISSNRTLCSPKLEAVCSLNQALVALQRGSSSVKSTGAALRASTTAKKELRSIYAMIALNALATDQWRSLDASAVDRATRALAANWKHTDPSVRYFLIARATKAFPTILERGRASVKSFEIDASEKSITRRLRALKVFEARAALISQIPVNSVRALTSHTVFVTYTDLITDMRAIPAPANSTPAQLAEHKNLLAALSNPFAMKSRKLRDAAIGLDLREKSGLDSDSIRAIWNRSGALNAAGEALRKEWAKAVSDENWSRVAFLSDEASDLKSVPSGWSKAARAASLAEAGAAFEAKVVFGDACRDSTGAPSVREACRIVALKGRG